MNAYPNGCIKCGNTHDYAGYIYGFCDACAKSILNTAAKRYQRKAASSAPKIDKRLEQDIARAQAAIAALATAENRYTLRSVCETPSPEELASLRQAIDSESRRMTRALTDHRLLWSIYRRTDKTAPYFDAVPVSEPVAASIPEFEVVAA
jgi:hypothetical protein